MNDQKQPEFQLHRSAPRDDADGAFPVVPLLVVVVMLVGGGLFYTSQQGAPAATPTPVASPTGPIEEAPAGVWERLNFLVDQERGVEALDYGRAQLELYNDPDLRARVKELDIEINGAVTESVSTLLTRAQQAASRSQWLETIEATTTILERDEEHAEAYYLRGVARGNQGNKAGAGEDLRSAKDYGFDTDKVETALEALNR